MRRATTQTRSPRRRPNGWHNFGDRQHKDWPEALSLSRMSIMTDRSDDWFRQAEADLEHAELSARESDYEWSSFAAQQAAEKAIKAVYLFHHGDPWGHSLLTLMQSLPAEIAASVTRELLDSARVLDKGYIQARYPNGFALGAPVDYFTERDALEAIAHAKSILEFCRSQIRRP
jgi:HEPN domain-containing protein